MRLHDAHYEERLAQIRSLEEEVARLRLTDAEREAVREAALLMEEMWDKSPGPQMVATLRGLLERLK